MKKLLFIALIFFGCNSSVNMDTVKKELVVKANIFLKKATSGGLIVQNLTIYRLDRITEKDAINFRIKALSDSIIIQKRVAEGYKQTAEGRKTDMKSMDSLHIATVEIKRLIDRYYFMADSTIAASAITKKALDSLSAISSADVENKDYYKAMSSICSINITSAPSCDSIAILADKQRNIISMYLK